MRFFELKMRVIAPLVVMCCLIGAGSQVAQAQTTYTSDGNISHFTAGVSGTSATTYATLSHFTGGDVSSPYTPTPSSVASGFRVFGGNLTGTGLSTTPAGQNWIEATFPLSLIHI